MAANFKQDMPPRTGYGPIDWAQKIPKRGFSGFAVFGGFLGFTGCAWVLHYYGQMQLKREKLEVMESRIAIEPLILAEKQRMMLKHFRKVREEENELMKDYPGWETGKLFDEPLFNNPRGRYIEPGWYEYYSHNSWWDLYNRIYERGNH